MEETYTISAITLCRRPFRENDSRIVVYSRERGKMALIARGTGFIKSKLSGHIEPFSELDIMVARGRRFDYIAGAKSRNRFHHLQDDFGKINAIGTSFVFLNGLLEENEADADLYLLILDYLQALNKALCSDLGYFFSAQAFIFKIQAKLGFSPELYFCVKCAQKTKSTANYFDFSAGGIVCSDCISKKCNPIPDNVLEILRFIIKNNFEAILKLEAEKKDLTEAMKNISLYTKFRSA
jgi:DNA repair protein RecO (recombination protein O)